MRRDLITLYPGHPAGELRANRIGSLVKDGLDLDIIHPGYDAQGRRRNSWTQFVHEGVPIYEVRLLTSLDNAITKFDGLWDRAIDDDILLPALIAVKKERIQKYRDGVSGESPAPALSRDGRQGARQYPS